MFVDTALLHSGAFEAHRASEHLNQAAKHLSRVSLDSSMFGDFTAAQAFQHATALAQAHHLRLLREHRDTLSALGRDAHLAATTFTAIDQGNAMSIRAVRCDSAS